MDDGLGRVRRGDGNVGLADRLFGRSRHFDVYPEDGGHLLRERFAMRLVSTEASESPNGADRAEDVLRDRKSTRLNSSHLGISYAVFCLKKKNKTADPPADPS